MGITKNTAPAILSVLIVCLMSACTVKESIYQTLPESKSSALNISLSSTGKYSCKQTDTPEITKAESDTSSKTSAQNVHKNTQPLTTKIAVTSDKTKEHLQFPTRSARSKWNFDIKVSEVHANDEFIYVEIIDNDNQGFTLDLADFELEFMQDSQWINITNSTMISSENYFLPQENGNAFAKFKLFVKKITDRELIEGTYRLVGTVSGKKIYAEFDVLP